MSTNRYDDERVEAGLKRPNDIIGRLEYLPPPITPNIQTTGFDAMVVFLRKLYATEVSVLDVHRHKDEEAQCRILQYAWRRFSESEVDEEAEKLDILKDMGFADNVVADFKSIMERLTIWARVNFALWNAILWTNGDAPWAIAADQTRRDHEHWLITMDCDEKQKSLQDCMDAQFGLFTDASGRFQTMWTCAEPGFVRVSYKPNKAQPLSFKELWSFELPIPATHQRENLGPMIVIDDKVVRYVLVAAVRLRDAECSRDFIRTYATTGAFIDAQGQNTCFNYQWSVTKPANYVLLYQRSPNAIRHAAAGETANLKPPFDNELNNALEVATERAAYQLQKEDAGHKSKDERSRRKDTHRVTRPRHDRRYDESPFLYQKRNAETDDVNFMPLGKRPRR